MNMQSYLNEIEHAATICLNAVWEELKEKDELEQRIKKLTNEMEEGYRKAETFKQYEDADDYMLGVGIYWDTYFGADKERFHAVETLGDIKEKILVRDFSICSLAASILQFAKQAISIVHKTLNKCPKGRSIGSQTIENIIWQSRNQSLHWEEGVFKPSVSACFSALENDSDTAFSEYTARNMAFDIIKLLEWQTFEVFKRDMLSLA